MATNSRSRHEFILLVRRISRLIFGLSFLWIVALVPRVHAQDQFDDLDAYTVRFEGYWLYPTPSGTLQGASGSAPIDLKKDLAFNSYSTGLGRLDWKFTRKNHLYFEGIRFTSSRQTVLFRTITFQGQTFSAGLVAQSSLDSPLYILGYQYDIIRRRRGHFGIGPRIHVFDTHASISAAAQITGMGVQSQAVSASASLLAPLPLVGPEGRFYLTDSPRLFIEGNVYGMYLGGYGSYYSSSGDVGFSFTRHLSVSAGYALASRLDLHNKASTNRIGLSMTQRGPLAGFQLSF
jgi:hypothetical protein